jgi:hypothetical protein
MFSDHFIGNLKKKNRRAKIGLMRASNQFQASFRFADKSKDNMQDLLILHYGSVLVSHIYFLFSYFVHFNV